MSIEPDAYPTEIDIFDYTPERVNHSQNLTTQEIIPYLDTESISWIDIQGLGDEKILREIGEIFKLPLLILEDIVNVPQRPKLEYHPDFLLITTQMIMVKNKGFWTEQVSFILGKNYLLTIQEEPLRDPFDPVRNRLEKNVGFIRQLEADCNRSEGV